MHLCIDSNTFISNSILFQCGRKLFIWTELGDTYVDNVVAAIKHKDISVDILQLNALPYDLT